jgi:hypothetical protein
MQRPDFCRIRQASLYISFSILGRIGGDATLDLRVLRWRCICFQYPRSDRRRCNYEGKFPGGGTAVVFQYPRSDRRRCNKRAGTGMFETAPGSTRHFQYPRSDRRRCNDGPRPACPRQARSPVRVFQYPRSDRRRCNPVTRMSDRPYLIPLAFSILGRIGGDATSPICAGCVVAGGLSVSSVGSEAMQQEPAGTGASRGIPAFQYPRSDRRRCNVCKPAWSQSTPTPSLSVSSVGSEAMQPVSASASEQPIRGLHYRSVAAVLSVSSVGSEAMQLQLPTAMPVQGNWPFSILGRIGGDATGPGLRQALGQRWPPFSILGRIGGDATAFCKQCQVATATPHFQYPRSDRRRCNPPMGRTTCHNAPNALSVSSVGSEAMQLEVLDHLIIGHGALSVSSVGSEAMQLAGGWLPGHDPPLSVSSVGSEAMQRACRTGAASGHGSLFQYPRSDRRRCNSRLALGNRAGPSWESLSVSSVGSEAMQLEFSAGLPRQKSFSILGRIGGDATLFRPAACLPLRNHLSVSSVGSEAMQRPPLADLEDSSGRNFQYPRSDRRRCNDLDCCPSRIMPLPLALLAFQYPRSDRRRCNGPVPAGPVG